MDIKKYYSHFVILFMVLVLSSSALVNPRSWWSIHKVVEVYDSGFVAQISVVKISFYALFTIILIAILNQPSIKSSIMSSLHKIKTYIHVNI